jgi:hypothetical protein
MGDKHQGFRAIPHLIYSDQQALFKGRNISMNRRLGVLSRNAAGTRPFAARLPRPERVNTQSDIKAAMAVRTDRRLRERRFQVTQ